MALVTQTAAAGAAAVLKLIATISAGAALGGVASQGAALDHQRALVEDRASQAGASAARPTSRCKSASEPMGVAAAEGQALQSQAAARGNVEQPEKRWAAGARAIDRYALGQAGLAVDHERIIVVDEKGRRAGHRPRCVHEGC